MPHGLEQHAICSRVIRLLRQERTERGVSKYKLAIRTGLAQQSISYIERGLRQPAFETILRIADGIGVRLEEVLKRARTGPAKNTFRQRSPDAKRQARVTKPLPGKRHVRRARKKID